MKPVCPKCTNESLVVERRPDGSATCLHCKWYGPYTQCFSKEFPPKTFTPEDVHQAYENGREYQMGVEDGKVNELVAKAKPLHDLWSIENGTKLYISIEDLKAYNKSKDVKP